MERKKILIIAEDMALTAPGIVYRNLIPFLSNKYEITILTSAIDEQIRQTSHVSVIIHKKKPRVRHRIEMKMYEWFGHNLVDDIIVSGWVNAAKHGVNLSDYHAVLSFASHWHFLPIMVGKKLKVRLNNLKWIIYSVDAIPGPTGWVSQRIHEQLSKWVAKNVNGSDGFFSANDMMLNYELSLLGSYKGYTGCVYTPWRPSQLDYSKKIKCIDMVFLYTGSVYGLRHVRALLKGFRLFVNEEPNAKLVFVGSKIAKDLESYQDLVNDGRIEVHGFTKDLDSFLVNADVLIDIGADVENDVFLSSKIVNYLILEKPILSITGSGSPSRLMMGDVKSIIHCDHKAEEICNAMRRAVAQKDQSVQDREQLISTFDPRNVANRFIDDLDRIIEG